MALNSDSKSKCLFRSVARMASIARNLNRLNSTGSSSQRKLYLGSDMRREKAAAAWWFSSTDLSLYSKAWRRRNLLRHLLSLCHLHIQETQKREEGLLAVHLLVCSFVRCLYFFFRSGFCFKPRRNTRNISTQQSTTMFDHVVKRLTKHTQHFTERNISQQC